MTLESISGGCGCRAIELQRFRHGELAGAEKERVAGHVASCSTCKARVAAFEREDAKLLASVDVAVESAKILERLEAPDAQPAATAVNTWWRSLFASRALQAALLLVLVAVPVSAFLLRDGQRGNRLKGSVALEMYVKDEAGIRLATNEESLKEGDQIQFRYRAAGKRYVFVVSVSNAGEVDPLYPDAPATSIPVSPSGTHILEGSVILDDTRGHERVFAFFSDEPLAYDEVKRALAAKLSGASDVTRLQEVDVGREDVDEATVLFKKE